MLSYIKKGKNVTEMQNHTCAVYRGSIVNG